jgi:hypothetical protein
MTYGQIELVLGIQPAIVIVVVVIVVFVHGGWLPWWWVVGEWYDIHRYSLRKACCFPPKSIHLGCHFPVATSRDCWGCRVAPMRRLIVIDGGCGRGCRRDVNALHPPCSATKTKRPRRGWPAKTLGGRQLESVMLEVRVATYM